jgi:signal transduction histidine kinase
MEIPSPRSSHPASSQAATDPTTGKETPAVVAALRERITDGDISGNVHRFRRGDAIVREGLLNDSIYLILEGRVHLIKHFETESAVAVGTLDAGDFVGLISFYSDTSAFSSALAKSEVITLRFTHDEFDRLSSEQPELAALIQPLVLRSLAERYRRIVTLHLEVAALTHEVEAERNRLQEALDELQSTRNRLIHQEKMAILGQLVAGIAHELNNPASALMRGAENLSTLLPETTDPATSALERQMLTMGMTRQLMGTEEQRERMEYLGKLYPHVRRSDTRVLAQLQDESIKAIEPVLKAKTDQSQDRLGMLLRWFEIGMFLRNIQVSGDRIGGIVKSLRGYSRDSATEEESADIVQGIRDTLLMVGNRLKNIKVVLNLSDVLRVRCRPGEINQVWTNVILNACDAMEDRGTLRISAEVFGSETASVRIADSGSGVPPEMLQKIFELNFTTKNASGSFGLGLGLAISHEIVSKYGGTIELHNAPEGGAVCTIVLPLDPAVMPSAVSPA